MSDPIVVDGAVKGPTAGPPKPEAKAEPGERAKSAGPFSAPVPKPPPGMPTSWLGKLGLTKRQAAVAASAVFSLAAGVAGVRLIWPSGDTQDPPATQPLVAQSA